MEESPGGENIEQEPEETSAGVVAEETTEETLVEETVEEGVESESLPVGEPEVSTPVEETEEPTEAAEAAGDEVVVVDETPTVEPEETTDTTEATEEPEETTDTTEPTEEPDEASDYEQTGPYPWEIPTLLTHSPDEVIWWYPDLMKDAFELINPNSVGADEWEVFSKTSDNFTPAHGHYVFYTGPEVANMRRAWRVAAEDDFWHSVGWFYYPVRYDVSFVYDNTVRIVGTWPLGETREARVGRDGKFRQMIDNEDYPPPPPPLAPLPPFTEPDYPEHALALGRNCPSVETLWYRNGRVTDPCTLIALQNAVQYAMGAATVDQTEAAIRDGHGARDAIQQRKDIHNAHRFNVYWRDPANPGHSVVALRSIYWAGRFAGASRIYLEWRRYLRPGSATPEFQQYLREEIQADVEAGKNVPDLWLGDELPEETIGQWAPTVMVRTADGTWRMSYTKWCKRVGVTSFSGVPGKPVQCPEDPNPVWADAPADAELFFPPNKVYYWKKQTPAQLDYYGQPPS